MDAKDMETLLDEAGWTYVRRTRYHQTYIYASRRFGRKVREVYFGNVNNIQNTTREQVLAKLAARTAEDKK